AVRVFNHTRTALQNVMRKIPVISGLWNYLTAPKLPATSLSISQTHLALISLRRAGRGFVPRNLSVLRLPPGLIHASFTEPNVVDEITLIDYLKRTATQAGLGRIRGISATLPASSARCLVITLDNVPGSRAEIEQMLEWKIERSVGQKAADLRFNYARLS